MAYQVFARKWRPKSFSSLKGQTHVTRALMNALMREQLHHAYLFTGTRGVGKTSIARILAKALNCEKGIQPEPCGQCGACLEIDAGRFVDLIEVDAASRTRVEDTRELLENVQYAPSSGRFKIYLIDEVHMLSGHSFNALLKTLEEPPPHVKFILATTEPERIPITVLSRCLRLNLRPLLPSDICVQLEAILTTENIAFEQGACQKIAELAAGSMRDALSLLEQAIAYGAGQLKIQDVEEMLGISYQRYLPLLITALETHDLSTALQLVENMTESGADFEQVLKSLLQVLHAVAILQILPNEENALASIAMVDRASLALKAKLTPEEVQLWYQIGLTGQRDLRFAPDPRVGFEMTLLRMMAFRPLSAKNEVAFQPKEAPSQPKEVPSQPKEVLSQPKEVLSQPKEALSQPKKALSEDQPKPLPLSLPPKEKKEANQTTTNQTTAPVDWAMVCEKLVLSGFSRALVRHCVLSSFTGDKLSLTLDESQRPCLNPQREAQIQEAVSRYFGRAIKVVVTVGEIQNAKTPSQQAELLANERQKEANQAVSQDSIVQEMIASFDATIEKVEPITE